jgi:monothiol glutaredoxin
VDIQILLLSFLKNMVILTLILGLTSYKSINVLDNPIIREEVKIYSNWPTFPQLYIDGQLIGGSNILHEMHKDESLGKLLNEKGLI